MSNQRKQIFRLYNGVMSFLNSIFFFLTTCVLSTVEHNKRDLRCWNAVENKILAVNECFQNIARVMKKNSCDLIFIFYIVFFSFLAIGICHQYT